MTISTIDNTGITAGFNPILPTQGGTGLTSPGTAGNVLTSTGTAWQSAAPAPGTTFSGGTTGFTPNTDTSGAVTLAGTLGVANGGTGVATLAANGALIGNGTSAISTIAPGANGNVLTSNGTSWTSGSAPVSVFTGTWQDVTVNRSFGTQYTNSRSYPIAVSARTTCSGGSAISFFVGGVNVSNFNWQWNGCGSFGGGFAIVPPNTTYQLNSGQGLNFWVELF